MQIQPTNFNPSYAIDSARKTTAAADQLRARNAEKEEVREAFTSFVGQAFFGQMLSAMRKTVGKPAYFHGGRTEEIFQQQLDQVLGEKLAEASGDQFAEPMFELFMMDRK